MSIAKWSPMKEIEEMTREMESMFSDFPGHPAWRGRWGAVFAYSSGSPGTHSGDGVNRMSRQLGLPPLPKPFRGL